MSLLESILFDTPSRSLPWRLLQRLLVRWVALNPKPVELELLTRALHHPDAEVQRIAERGLRQLKRDYLKTLVCLIWARTRDPRLETLLSELGWIAERPPEVRVLTLLLQGTPEEVGARIGSTMVEPLLKACEDADPRLAERARAALLALRRKDARAALWTIVRENGHPLALKALAQSGEPPRDENERALFWFLLGQWQEYEALDFDRRRLRAVYATASAELRARIREQLRAAGRPDFLTVLTGGETRLQAEALSPAETRTVLELLVGMGAWREVWDLALKVQVAWGAWAVERLVAAGWEPEDAEEQALLRTLHGLTQAGLLAVPDEIRRRQGLLDSHTLVRVPGRVNDVVFAPRSPWIAVATGTRHAVIWDYTQGKRKMLLGNHFDHAIGSVAFTPDERVLLGERTNQKEPVDLFLYTMPPDNTMRRLGSHEMMIALAVPNDRWALSAGREGLLRLWDLEDGRLLQQHETQGDWTRQLCVVDEAHVLYLGRLMRLISLPDLKEQKWRFTEGRITAATVCGKDVLLGRFSGEVIALDLSDMGRAPKRVISSYEKAVVGLATLARYGLVLSVDGSGLLRVLDTETYEVRHEQRIGKGRATSLHLSPDEAFMVLGLSETAFALLDLRFLALPWLFAQPLARLGPDETARIRWLAGQTHLLPDVQRALQFAAHILHYRWRYEIELEQAPELVAGEFDIEIEG